jgi:hypothetical protein
MLSKLAILVAAVVPCTSPALAQGGGGAGGAGSGGAGSAGASSSSGTGASETMGAGSPNGSSSSQPSNQNRQGAAGNPAAFAKHNAVTGANTQPASPSSGAVSAPGVGVGHAANGVPIGEPGSGPGSPEQPIDARNMSR